MHIHATINFLAEELSTFLKNELGVTEKRVNVERLVDHNGDEIQENQNKLVFSLTNITSDINKSMYSSKVGFTHGAAQLNSPLFLNIDFLLAASFMNELEGMKFLSSGMKFFHEHSLFNRETNPNLPEGVEKVSVEMCNLSIQDLEATWSAIGARMIPATMYKIRIVTNN